MTKSELVQRLADTNPHLYQRDIEVIVTAIFDEIAAALARGDRVELRGFGAFSVKHRDARVGEPAREFLATGAIPIERPPARIDHARILASNPVNAAQHRNNADRLLRMTEGGAFRSENRVRPNCQFEPATETKSLDGGNDRQRKPLEAVENRHVLIERRPQLTHGHIGPVHDVAAKTEIRSIRAKEYRTEFAGLDLVDGIGKLRAHRLIDAVLGRVFQRYDGNRALTLQADQRHFKSP